MRSPSDADGGLTTGRLLRILGLLWLAGIASRITILAVPPVIPLIHDDLRMTETQVGLLIGLPLVMFALCAIPGSLLISRFGATATMIAGMLITAIAAGARGGAPNVLLLYVATAIMGFGVAIMQPSLPTLVKSWVPERHVGLATAVSTNGLMVGVASGPALTLPLVLPFVGREWRLDFLIWAILALVMALIFLAMAPRISPAVQTSRAPREVEAPGSRAWWPDWKNPLIWLLGFTFGSNNALYYGTNAFLADYLHSRGLHDLVGASVGALNVAQLVASIVLLATADKLQQRAWPYLVFGPLAIAGVFGVVLGNGLLLVAAAALVGFSLSVTFVVTLALPPILSPPGEIHRLAGGMFTISYSCAVIIPIICGAFWDLTGIPWTAFIPVGLCGLTLTALGFFLSVRNPAR
ncbi:MAG: MFS transporter [Pseudomonadota bacterium]